MKIGLDYDQTFTEDPIFWRKFIKDAQKFGHEVMIVTYRDPGLPIEHDINIPVYYTSYKSKRNTMLDLGIKIDVWIDDSPEAIIGDSNWTDEDRAVWLKNHKFEIEQRKDII